MCFHKFCYIQHENDGPDKNGNLAKVISDFKSWKVIFQFEILNGFAIVTGN